MVPPNGKTGPKSYGGYVWAEESLLPGGTSPLIISNDDDDDLVSVNELFARADPDPAPTAATATPAAGAHKRQIPEAVRREECPNGPETTPAAPQQQAKGTDTCAGTGTGAGAANNTRKSGRARKPKRYN
jgi:hypothetical protein